MCISDFRALAEPADFTILGDRIVIWPKPVKRKTTAKTMAFSSRETHDSTSLANFNSRLGFMGIRCRAGAIARRTGRVELEKEGRNGIDAPLKN